MSSYIQPSLLCAIRTRGHLIRPGWKQRLLFPNIFAYQTIVGLINAGVIYLLNYHFRSFRALSCILNDFRTHALNAGVWSRAGWSQKKYGFHGNVVGNSPFRLTTYMCSVWNYDVIVIVWYGSNSQVFIYSVRCSKISLDFHNWLSILKS